MNFILKIVALYVAAVSAANTEYISALPQVDDLLKDRAIDHDIFIPDIKPRNEVQKPYPEELDVTVKTARWHFRLHLQLNKWLISPSFTSVYYDDAGNEIVSKGHPNCFYHGEVEGHQDWTVSMSVCHGLSGTFGDHSNKSQLFHIEPLGQQHFMEAKHIIFLGTELRDLNGSCGTPHDTSRPFDVSLSDEYRLRRQSSGQYLYVELIVVNDFAQYQVNRMNQTATVLRALQVINSADNLYKPLQIRLVLIQTITWTTGNKITVVSEPEDLLENFRAFRPQLTTVHDAALLFTGTSLDQPTVGIAFVSGMCNSYSSVGVIQDTRGSVSQVSAITAHELGHLFSMQHDDSTCRCSTASGCIMSATLSSTPPTLWSTCSTSYLNMGLRTMNLGTCLANLPTMSVADPVCGNGIREGTEVCDCGSVQECNDPCCNPKTCQLAAGALCAAGACCSKCKFVPYGTICRAASSECDIAEYCSGRSLECPSDRHLPDGTACASNGGYCFSGTCPTTDKQCKYFYGPDGGAGYRSCYTVYNTRGDFHGNCGSVSAGVYSPCSTSQVMCGSLQCANTGTQFPMNISGAGSTQLGTHGTVQETCKSFVYESSGQRGPDIWLVSDGTKCDNNKICFSRECTSISILGTISCPLGPNRLMCSGNGTCNDLGQCSCYVGFAGSLCENLSVDKPICGNGVREGLEVCDCGSAQTCKDPCCNPTTCQLATGAQCLSGTCCSACRFVAYGTTCRRAGGDCDITEYCSGSSASCPDDRRAQDGTPCGTNAAGYCYSGTCPTVDNQCKYFYGQLGGAGFSGCFTTYNTRGDSRGNCGSTGRTTYSRCNASDVGCGSLQCANSGTTVPSNIVGSGSIQYGSQTVGGQTCKSFVFQYSGEIGPDIWLVQNGTKCGTDKICVAKKCATFSSLGIRSCPLGTNGIACSKNGVCNDLAQCSCNVGYSGSACGSAAAASASVASTSHSDGLIPGIIVIGASVSALLVVAILGYIVYKRRKKARQARNSALPDGSDPYENKYHRWSKSEEEN